MTSFKTLGRLDSSRGWKEGPEERQGCWGPQLHAIRIAKAWLFGAGETARWPFFFVFCLGGLHNLCFLEPPEKHRKRIFQARKMRKQWWKNCKKNWDREFLKIFMFAVNTCIGCSTCLLLWSTCHQKRLSPPQMLSANEFELNLCFHRFVDHYLRTNYCNNGAPKKMADSTHSYLHDHSLVVCRHMFQQCVKIGLW